MSQIISKKGYKSVPWIFRKNIEIPKNWKVKTIKNVFELIVSGTNARSDLNENGEIQYVHYGDIHTKWSFELDCDLEKIPRISLEKVAHLELLKEGDLIMVDASEDVVGIGSSVLLKNVRNRKIVSGLHTVVLRNKDKDVSINFIKYLTSIPFVKIQITSNVTGAKVSGLAKKNINEIKVPFPSFSEQEKIASILSNVDKQIVTSKKIINKTYVLKRGLMQNLMEHGIGHTEFKTISDRPYKNQIIPKIWRWSSIKEEKFDVKSGSTPSRTHPEYFNGKVPWISSSEINYNKIIQSNEKITDEAIKNTNLKIFPKGTLLLAMYGRGKTRGRCSILKIDAAINQAIAAIDVKEENVLFYYYYLEFRYEKIRIGQGSGQPNLNLQLVNEIKIPIPPLSEQEKIASILSNVDKQIELEFKHIKKLKKLKRALIQKLLTGEVRVKV